ncbi:hypothetical protein [Citreimonas salinaria]|uniref:Uncharacterized protein n=1 Tax=Citreimonas salinaria TaxID=321339 RepID=A0A1H3NCX6_9RHOB|nr:hypothetical protein [Citreimonas salinaria]SDY86718.1 hypothetical protein SAMN05444340_1232 [Citreimonas salinaria]
MQVFGKTQDNLWTLIAAPAIWGFHFLFSYFLAAYRCAPNDDIFGTRAAIAVVTVICLLLILLIARRAGREWRTYGGAYRNDQATDNARERFLEFSTLLLAALSFVAVVFETLPIFVFWDCR